MSKILTTEIVSLTRENCCMDGKVSGYRRNVVCNLAAAKEVQQLGRS